MRNLFKFNFSMDVNPEFHPPAWMKWIFLSSAMLLACLTFIPFSPWMPTDGLDPSWVYAVNQAVERNLVFGRDFIFTYGPLGYVSTTQYSPGTDSRMLLMSAILIVGFVGSIYLSVPRSRREWLILLPVVLSLAGRNVVFVTFPFFLLLAISRATLSPRPRLHSPLAMARVFTLGVSVYAMGIIPLVKGNFIGTILPMTGLIFLSLWLYEKKLSLAFVGLLFFSTCVNWLISGQELKDITRYFIAMAPIISGYTNAMSIFGKYSSVVYVLLASILIVWTFFRAVLPGFGQHAWILATGMAFTLFVSFKTGFVRQDGHVSVMLEVLLLLAYSTLFYAKKWKAFGLCLTAGLAFSFVQESKTDLTPSHVKGTTISRFSRAWSGISERIKYPEKLSERYERAKENIRTKHPLPLVAGTVDIYPTELSTLFAHDLSWSGRPIPQSYSAYTSSLDAINAGHLRSERAPDTVFFRFGPIDGRLASIEDAGSVLELLSGYSISGMQPPYAILERNADSRNVALDYTNERMVQTGFGQMIEMGLERPTWMQADIRPTFMGRLMTMLFKSPIIQMEIVLDDERVITRRVIADIAASGFIVSPYLANTEDFVSLAAGSNFVATVKSVRFTTKYSGFWQNNISVKIIPIDITPQKTAQSFIFSEQMTDMDISRLHLSQDNARCHLDEANKSPGRNSTALRSRDGYLQIKGWTAPPVRVNDAPSIEALAVVQNAEGNEKTFKATVLMRPDVARHFERPGLQTSGYEFVMNLSDMPGQKKIQIKSVSDGIAYNCPLVITVD